MGGIGGTLSGNFVMSTVSRDPTVSLDADGVS